MFTADLALHQAPMRTTLQLCPCHKLALLGTQEVTCLTLDIIAHVCGYATNPPGTISVVLDLSPGNHKELSGSNSRAPCRTHGTEPACALSPSSGKTPSAARCTARKAQCCDSSLKGHTHTAALIPAGRTFGLDTELHVCIYPVCTQQ